MPLSQPSGLYMASKSEIFFEKVMIFINNEINISFKHTLHKKFWIEIYLTKQENISDNSGRHNSLLVLTFLNQLVLNDTLS